MTDKTMLLDVELDLVDIERLYDMITSSYNIEDDKMSMSIEDRRIWDMFLDDLDNATQVTITLTLSETNYERA